MLTELRKAVTTAPDKDAADVTGIMIDEVSATLAIAQGARAKRCRRCRAPPPANTPAQANRAPVSRQASGRTLRGGAGGLGQPQQAVTEFQQGAATPPTPSHGAAGALLRSKGLW